MVFAKGEGGFYLFPPVIVIHNWNVDFSDDVFGVQQGWFTLRQAMHPAEVVQDEVMQDPEVKQA